MAVDYKSLRALATSQPLDADDYCPECGRPWRDSSPEHAQPAAPFPWRATFLAVIGLALAIAFGARAARAYQGHATAQRDLAVLSTCVATNALAPGCPSLGDPDDWLRVEQVIEDTARRQFDRALVATAPGLLAVGLGLRAVARHRWRRDGPPPTLAAIWGMGESLLVLTCLQLLALTLQSIAVQLSHGLPLTWERLDTAADGVLVLVSLLTASRF